MKGTKDVPEYVASLTKLRSRPENRMCFDCSNPNPSWATLSYGVFICMDCAGIHRGMGVHQSFVRSCILDSWTPIQVKTMEMGGNGKAREFFRKHGSLSVTQDEKYRSPAARAYRQHIRHLVEEEKAKSESSNFSPPVILSESGKEKEVHSEGSSQQFDKFKKSIPEKQEILHTSSSATVLHSRHHFSHSGGKKGVGLGARKVREKSTPPPRQEAPSSIESGEDKVTADDVEDVHMDEGNLGDKVNVGEFEWGRSRDVDSDENDDWFDVVAKESSSPSRIFRATSANGFPVDRQRNVHHSDTHNPPQDHRPIDPSRFSGARAISSDEYFGNKSPHSEGNLDRFGGATSLSSDEYFGREPRSNSSYDCGHSHGSGGIMPELREFGRLVVEGGRKVGHSINEFFENLKEKYGDS